MAPVSLRLGDLVWGQLGQYPPWPAKIIHPPKELKKPRGKRWYFVKFFGMEDHAWIELGHLRPYHAHKEEMVKKNRGRLFQQAVEDVEEFLGTLGQGGPASFHSHAGDDDDDDDDDDADEDISDIFISECSAEIAGRDNISITKSEFVIFI